MRKTTLAAFALGGLVSSLALTACDLEVPDLNNPSLSDLENNPTAITLGAACTGLLIGNRRNHAAENGYMMQIGILGREAYNFDAADPRYVSELLTGKRLNQGSPFGGNFWALPYSNIQLGHIVIHALDKIASTEITDEQKTAIKGFTHTLQALDLFEVISTHDTNGAVIDTDRDPLGPLAPIVDRPTAYAKIVQLIDQGYTELLAGGGSFPFALSAGFAGFDTPATFAQFNRAMKARIAIYQPTPDYAAVLDALQPKVSFLDDSVPATIDFDLGVYFAYSTKPGDTANALINPNIYVHPDVLAKVQKDTSQNTDARLLRKTALAANASRRGTTAKFTKLYSTPETRVAQIRQEELLLLKAEALWFTGMKPQALAELNIVRTGSGHLEAIATLPATDADFVSALLYEREYSLLFEGHRWFDARRLNRLDLLPIFITVDPDTQKMTPDTLDVRYPLPLGECNARPGEPACALSST